MGAWGVGIYQNDIALDYMIELSEQELPKVSSVEEALVFINLFAEYGGVKFPESMKLFAFLDYERETIENWYDNCRDDRLVVLDKLEFKLKSAFANTCTYDYLSDEEFEKVKASEYDKWLNLIRAGNGFITTK